MARPTDSQDVLLCEELKHLYTALTRAKNNVIMFDSNTAKRAPFFNYLRRLGMAQYVSRSVSPHCSPFQHAPTAAQLRLLSMLVSILQAACK